MEMYFSILRTEKQGGLKMLWKVHYFLWELFQSLFFYLTKQQILLFMIDILLKGMNLAHARKNKKSDCEFVCL